MISMVLWLMARFQAPTCPVTGRACPHPDACGLIAKCYDWF